MTPTVGQDIWELWEYGGMGNEIGNMGYGTVFQQ